MTTGVGVISDVRRQRALAGEIDVRMFRGSMYIYSHASGRPKYMCRNMSVGADLSDEDWIVWKYSDADLPQAEGPIPSPTGIATEATLDALSWSF